MKKAIAKMLKDVAGEDVGSKIFEANFPPELTGYTGGSILTLSRLRLMEDGTVVHVRYFDEDGKERENGFLKIFNEGDDYFCADGFSFPLQGYHPDLELKNCDNSGWTFTLREALPAKKKKLRKGQKPVNMLEEMEEMKELISEESECADKVRRKEIKKKFNELNKCLMKNI